MKPTLLNPALLGSHSFWVHLHHRNHLFLGKPGYGRYHHHWGRLHLPGSQAKGSGGSACVYTTSSCGCASTTVTQLPPLIIPGSWWHPHHTGCHGCARSWLAWLSRCDSTSQLHECGKYNPMEGEFQQGEAPFLSTPDTLPVQLWTQPSIPPAGSLPVDMSWKIIGNTQRTDLAEFGPPGPADQVSHAKCSPKGCSTPPKVKVSPD